MSFLNTDRHGSYQNYKRMNRRQLLERLGGLAAGSLIFPSLGFSHEVNPETKFRYCLNTSTISGCGDFNVLDYIEIASKAGYDGIELWVGDVQDFLSSKGTLDPVKEAIQRNTISVENAIGFAPWLSGEKGIAEMKKDMKLMAEIGCKRIAAPPVGHDMSKPLDLFEMGEKYKRLMEIGRETGVMPQLEFWGASEIFYHIAQAVMVAVESGDPDARILPDFFHMFKGGSDFKSLEMLNPDLIDVFHLNDYDSSIPKAEQSDESRVYPGDGDAPIGKVIHFLNRGEKEKILSIELFNKDLWKLEAEVVAKTGLSKMKQIVSENS